MNFILRFQFSYFRTYAAAIYRERERGFLFFWQSLLPDWKNGETVSRFPGATNQKHPPRDWIKMVWSYLREFFTTAKEIQSLRQLPLKAWRDYFE